ncbi:MAG: ATP-dependent RecD-like DNA helicase [Lachnospiraceae bacterium]|jgi:exodeoxyribonuclease V alpha subunit|nr:ATP-dependent RecD-like DNA helicase [Lachnospiraceae bacterium]MEE3460980.1 ATP-dependent RecD-like DNA helicase [Lachnospiraceae bacterium]
MGDETYEGYIERIVFHSPETGFTVLSLSEADSGEEITCTGNFPSINAGEYIRLKGHMVDHREYGPQIKIDSYETVRPQNKAAIEKYLSSGAIKGIGEALAKRIVKKFGKDTFNIMERSPERLAEIRGISEAKARKIAEQFGEKRALRSACVYLQKYSVPMNLAVKIYEKYGESMYDIVERNPYKLVDDIEGVGFKTADKIAQAVGISEDSTYRLESGVLYTLNLSYGQGNCYLPEEELIRDAAGVLNVDTETISGILDLMCMGDRITAVDTDRGRIIYTSLMYNIELNTAKMIIDLNTEIKINEPQVDLLISEAERVMNIELDDIQCEAVRQVVGHGVTIITGGPGTGKTTAIKAIIYVLEKLGEEILLAAPTGRAAKRMTEATGRDAQTIHRLLEINAGPSGGLDSEKNAGQMFARNEDNPLETDVVIIDEMSMVDIFLMHALLKAVVPGTRLVLTGDANQLPSVGPGNVLKDLINADFCHVVRLEKIFRQAAKSDIIKFAHLINEGKSLNVTNRDTDFFVISRNDPESIIQTLVTVIMKNMPKHIGAKPYDIQVLSPMKEGVLGVNNLNKVLQKYMNPPSEKKREHEFHDFIFRENDKIMQVKNNYQMVWKKYNGHGDCIEEGKGVFNGDCGIIKDIDEDGNTVTVLFDDDKITEYTFNEMDEIVPAFAITIHKSQGSEYPAVLLPLLTGPRMLFNRNILYTAVTRARRCVSVIGSEETMQAMIANNEERKRYSGLADSILYLLEPEDR